MGAAGHRRACVVAAPIYWAQPWWYRRRMHLTPLTSEAAPLLDRLEQLRARPGPDLWSGSCSRSTSGGRHSRSAVSGVTLSPSAAERWLRRSGSPKAFDAVVLHELAHTRNSDINQTYLAIAIWRAFVITGLLPLIWLLIFSADWAEASSGLIWRVAVLALIVYSLRNSILRAREFDADARVREIDPGTAWARCWPACRPAAGGRRRVASGLGHPSGQDRAAALLDPAPLYRCGLLGRPGDGACRGRRR